MNPFATAEHDIRTYATLTKLVQQKREEEGRHSLTMYWEVAFPLERAYDHDTTPHDRVQALRDAAGMLAIAETTDEWDGTCMGLSDHQRTYLTKRFQDLAVPCGAIAHIVKLMDERVISRDAPRKILDAMFKYIVSVDEAVEALGLRLVNQDDEVVSQIQTILSDPKSASAIADFRAGNPKAINSIKGPVIKHFKGSVDPRRVEELLNIELGRP